MDVKALEGKVTFVQHEKQYVTIEYSHNGKSKTVNGSIKEEPSKSEEKKTGRKAHYFREGDEVSFILARSPRGDKMVADNIVFRYNNSLNELLHQAETSNRFSGYLKQVDDKFFIKEIGSYHFFPLRRSPWEKEFQPQELNEPVEFMLENISNPDKTSAVLLRRQFIPEYQKAIHYFELKSAIDATIVKVTPHGIHLSLIGNAIQAKLPLADNKKDNKEKPGEKIRVIITHIGPDKIAVRRAIQDSQ
ncbi:MAG: hypothetical protein H7Y42_04980 [Chitinophagaceae bacterium]|nr:hypothetical protein [Chitinophagaceae bacterium]